MGWAYWNPVRIAFGAGQFDKVGAQIAGRRLCARHLRHRPLPRLAGEARGLCRRAGRHHRQHRHQSGLRRSRRVLPPLRRGADQAGSDRRARRRLDDRCRQGARRERRRLRARAAPPHRAGAARCVDIPADHRGADHGRHGQRSHLMGDRVGRGRQRPKYSLANPRLYPEAAFVDPALTLAAPRGLTHDHRARRALARARKPVERERQSGLGELRGRGGARDHRRAAAPARTASTISICARGSRARACSPGLRSPTPRPRSRTTSPTASRCATARRTASPARSACRR